jgi:hypothetical protein
VEIQTCSLNCGLSPLCSTHSLYLEPGDHEVNAYPDESFPKWCGRFDGYQALNQYLQAQPAPEEEGSPVAAWAKIVGGLLLGGLPGVIAGAALTAMEGLPLGPGSDDPQDGALITLESSAPDVGPVPPQARRIVHSSSITIAVPDHVPWAADQNVPIDGRRYDFIVDRATQIWWPSEDGTKGYLGRWGPIVVNDPFNRRAGMRFPEFWSMFFNGLVKTAGQDFQ